MDEIRDRLGAVEAKVTQFQYDLHLVRGFASLADRDVGEFRGTLVAHVQALNALRETQLEQGRQLDDLRQVVDGHTETLDQHTQTLDRHTETLDRHTETLDRHTETLDRHTETLAEHGRLLTDIATTVHRIAGDA
jgi:chromosome segregation ATPase